MTTGPAMTDVAIVGGGPTGLMLAIELGARDVSCIVFDENTRAASAQGQRNICAERVAEQITVPLTIVRSAERARVRSTAPMPF